MPMRLAKRSCICPIVHVSESTLDRASSVAPVRLCIESRQRELNRERRHRFSGIEQRAKVEVSNSAPSA
jgi:hypothetical protein